MPGSLSLNDVLIVISLKSATLIRQLSRVRRWAGNKPITLSNGFASFLPINKTKVSTGRIRIVREQGSEIWFYASPVNEILVDLNVTTVPSTVFELIIKLQE